MSLTEEQRRVYGEKLEESLLDISNQIKNLEVDVDFGNDIDSNDEEADEVEEKSNLAGIKTTLQNRQQKIAKALLKMKSGGYGRCEKCGGEISSELLNIDPESELCRDCKQSS